LIVKEQEKFSATAGEEAKANEAETAARVLGKYRLL